MVTAKSRLQELLSDLDRLAHWVGREEPRRAELWNAVEDLKVAIERDQDASRAALRCAVAVNGLWSTALKRLLDARIREVYTLLSNGGAHHAA